jgi:small subunit ribosomal protein S20
VANTLSAKKRIRQTAKRRLRNRSRKKQVRVQIKKLAALMDAKNIPGAESALRTTIQTLDRVAAKGTLHRNTVARKKSRLMRKLNALKAPAAA